MSGNPVQPHSIVCEGIIQCLLALLYEWRCSGGLKGFQSHVAVSANTHILLWCTMQLNFITTGHHISEHQKTLLTFLEKY
jgi:hypothetical protein